MARRLLKVCLLISLFHLDVRLKAEVPLTLPANCWDRGGECLVKAKHEMTFLHGKAKFALAPETILRRMENENFNLLEGKIWLSAENAKLLFELPNGKLTLTPETKLLLVRNEEGVQIQVLEGLVEMRPLGLKPEVLNFPAGYCFDIGWMNSQGEVQVSLPRSLALTQWTSLFYHFYQDLSASQLKAKLEEKIGVWQHAVKTATELQSSLADRQITDAKARQQKLAQAKARKEAEDRELRALFRKKNYLE